LRKGGTEAAAHATTERNPRIGLGGAFEEALGPEGVRIGRIQRGVVLHEEDRGCQLSPWLEAVTAQFDRLLQRAEDLGDDWPDAQRLLDHGLGVVTGRARLYFGGQPLEGRGRA